MKQSKKYIKRKEIIKKVEPFIVEIMNITGFLLLNGFALIGIFFYYFGKVPLMNLILVSFMIIVLLNSLMFIKKL